jgi:hypothetical protein
MEAVTSLSEPDVYTQAVALRLSGEEENIVRDLLASATKVLFNPALTRDTSLNVVKFRSFCIEVADLLSAAFPDAGNLFLFRDLGAYIKSTVRAFAIDETPPDVGRAIAEQLATMAPLLAEELKEREELNGVEGSCLIWLSAMHAYARWHEQGIPMLAVRYEELVAQPSRVVERILQYLGLPIEQVSSALRVFERDSQAGSPLSREVAAGHGVQIDDRRWDLVRDLVRRYPIVDADIPGGSFSASLQ